MANWNWKVVREFVQQHFGRRLSRSSCLNYLHRLGFVLKRPKKRLLKAKAAAREAFVACYAQLRLEAEARGAKIFFADEAHFRADAPSPEGRGKWVLRGQPALVGSTSPRWGEKASYYSVLPPKDLETGEVEVMELTGNSTAATSAAFLQQLRANHPEPLVVIWDNGPAHRGAEIREYLSTPGLALQLVPLPAYSPDFLVLAGGVRNPDEAIWDWVREEVTANTCLGTTVKVQERVGEFFRGLADRAAEVQQRCRRALQSRADAPLMPASQSLMHANHVDSTLALV